MVGLWLGLKPVALEGCLAAFFATERLRGAEQFFCDGCRAKTDAEKSLRLVHGPEVLCLHIKRFRRLYWVSHKLYNGVSFPLKGLDMRPYLTPAAAAASAVGEETPDPLLYDLVGLVEHTGGLQRGHYTAHVRDAASNRWFYASDEDVHQVTAAAVARRNPYVLFYQRRAAPRSGAAAAAIAAAEAAAAEAEVAAVAAKATVVTAGAAAKVGVSDAEDTGGGVGELCGGGLKSGAGSGESGSGGLTSSSSPLGGPDAAEIAIIRRLIRAAKEADAAAIDAREAAAASTAEAGAATESAEERAAAGTEWVYIDRSWAAKWAACATPGPVCNHRLVCRHGRVKPHVTATAAAGGPPLGALFVRVPRPVFELLVAVHGPSPDLAGCGECGADGGRSGSSGSSSHDAGGSNGSDAGGSCSSCNGSGGSPSGDNGEHAATDAAAGGSAGAAVGSSIRDGGGAGGGSRRPCSGGVGCPRPALELSVCEDCIALRTAAVNELKTEQRIIDGIYARAKAARFHRGDDDGNKDEDANIGGDVDGSDADDVGAVDGASDTNDEGEVGGGGDGGEAAVGDLTWCLVSSRWLSRWQQYIQPPPEMGYDADFPPTLPGPITNHDLVDDAGKPHPRLAPMRHYVALLPEAWEYLQRRHTGGPVVRRNCADGLYTEEVTPPPRPQG
ncbi:unnamed protein product [Phaeothamnion confervicola]